jgi:hypothetical protein
VGRDVVADRDQPAVAPGAQPNALDRSGGHADELKDLLPGHRDLDWPVQPARGKRRQDRFRVDPKLGAEPASDVRRHEMEPLRVDACWRSRCVPLTGFESSCKRSGRSHPALPCTRAVPSAARTGMASYTSDRLSPRPVQTRARSRRSRCPSAGRHSPPWARMPGPDTSRSRIVPATRRSRRRRDWPRPTLVPASSRRRARRAGRSGECQARSASDRHASTAT